MSAFFKHQPPRVPMNPFSFELGYLKQKLIEWRHTHHDGFGRYLVNNQFCELYVAAVGAFPPEFGLQKIKNSFHSHDPTQILGGPPVSLVGLSSDLQTVWLRMAQSTCELDLKEKTNASKFFRIKLLNGSSSPLSNLKVQFPYDDTTAHGHLRFLVAQLDLLDPCNVSRDGDDLLFVGRTSKLIVASDRRELASVGDGTAQLRPGIDADLKPFIEFLSSTHGIHVANSSSIPIQVCAQGSRQDSSTEFFSI